MEFALTPDQERFASDFDNYLKTHMSPELISDIDTEITYSELPSCREFIRQLGRDGWLGVGWPIEYGGQGRGAIEQHLFYEIATYHRVPLPVLPLNTVGPTLMRFGSAEQKASFLPRILRGEIDISVGYTEPEAGTDLASLKTAAVQDGDYYIINGQKVFTSLANTSDYIWLAARTDFHVSKHKGISIFLIDLHTPGISIEPFYTMGGERNNATFYDDVWVHKSCLVGEENSGWKYITTQLDFERIMLAPSYGARRNIEDTILWAKETTFDESSVIDHPWVKHQFARLLMEVEVLRLMNLQVAWQIEKGTVPYAEASAVKVYGSEMYQRINNVLLEIMGEFGQLKTGSKWTPLRGRIEKAFRSDLVSIFGGGVIEVQRDIIAVAGLGLPSYARTGQS